jgi:hypothetical protein
MPKNSVLTPSQVLETYKKKIVVAHHCQGVATQAMVSAIVEIGRLCQEAKQYKDRLSSKDKNDLWKKFEDKLPISKASITKYISIAENNVLKLKRNHKYLPPSVFTLYELSQISDTKLTKMIQSGVIHSEVGRTELLSKIKPKLLTNKSKQAANEIEVLSIRLSVDEWEQKFISIKEELLEFLDNKGIKYSYGSEIIKRQKIESSHSKNFTKYLTTQFRKFFTKRIRDYINEQGRAKHLFAGKKSLSFERKVKLVGFNMDEVDLRSCISESEIKDIVVPAGFCNEDEWNILMSKFVAEAFEKYPVPTHLMALDSDVTNVEMPALLGRKNTIRDKSKFKLLKV